MYGVGTVNNKTKIDMIKKTKSFITSDNVCHATLEAAQKHSLMLVFSDTMPPETASDVADIIIAHADQVRECLPKKTRKKRTPKASVDPKLAKARKVLETGRGSFTTHEPK